MKVKLFLENLPRFFNARAAGDLETIIGFRVNGENSGDYNIRINNGKCAFGEGIPETREVLLEGDEKVYIDIINGELTLARAHKSGALKLEGVKKRAYNLHKIFSGAPKSDEAPPGLYGMTDNEKGFESGKWEVPKKVLAIQGSPRGPEGLTQYVLQYLIQGMSDAGVRVETMNLMDKKIGYCRGCFACWAKSDGECIQRDDMDEMLPLIPHTDLLVLAFPLYVNTFPGLLKNFIDRLLPMKHPYIFQGKNRCRHPSRYPRLPNLAALSICAFYEKENFKSISSLLEDFSRDVHMPLIAKIFRPHAAALKSEFTKATSQPVKEAIREAGRQIINNGKISRRLQEKISAPIISKAHFLAAAKDWWFAGR